MKNLALLFCILTTSATVTLAESKPQTLAALLPLTGSAAEQGDWIRRGLELAAHYDEQANPGGLPLSTEETNADPKTAISAYRNLRTRFSVPIVFTYGSGVGVALSPLVNNDHVIQIGLATASPAYSSPEDYTFRVFPSAELEASFLVNAMLEQLSAQVVAIIKIQNEYGVGSAKAFRAEYENRGGKVIADEVIEPNGADYRATLLRVKQLNPKTIYLAVYPGEGAVLLKQAREIGLTAPFVASVAILGSKEFLKIAGKAAEGLIVATSSPVFRNSSDEAIKTFVDRYQERFGEEPGVQHIFAARGYDAMNLARQALRACASKEPDCIRDFLFGIKDYHGAGGRITFDRNGDMQSSFSLQVIRAGEFHSFMSK